MRKAKKDKTSNKLLFPILAFIWLLIKLGELPQNGIKIVYKRINYISVWVLSNVKWINKGVLKFIKGNRLGVRTDRSRANKGFATFEDRLGIKERKGFFKSLKQIRFDRPLQEQRFFHTKKSYKQLQSRYDHEGYESFKLYDGYKLRDFFQLFKLREIKLPFMKRGRGRPRTQPLLPFYRAKVTRFLDFILPKPLRIGILILFISTGFFFYSMLLVMIAHDLPDPKKLSPTNSPLTTEFYDRRGKLLYKLYEGKNRTLVKLEELPQHLINATIAIEDKNFYAHPGFDIFGIARAAQAYIQENQIQGGSTITQQLIKNTLLTPERNWERKIKEIALAFWAERIYSKEEILQMYFNEVAYGGPAWGIEAAAQTYFNKSAKDLNLAESAFLSGLPASPTTYSPYGAHPELAVSRQKMVLKRMVEDGYISQEEADNAIAQKLVIAPQKNAIKAPHFVMYVRALLAQRYGEKTVSQGGLKVITSLDIEMQEMAENVVASEVANLANLQVGNGAAMISDPKTGEILAMVGSKNYFDANAEGNFNVATALRQPGSAIKPVTYVTGFKQGYSPGNILLDTPVTFKNAWESYSPVNYDGKFHGPVTIRTSLGSSYNIPAVKMLAIVGIPQMIQTAKDMGITTFEDSSRYGLSLTLGGGEVTLLDMMTVYNTFANNGVVNEPRPILTVTDPSGVVLEDNRESVGKQVIEPALAYMVTDILADNGARTPAFGPSSLLNIPGAYVAVKTGTTDNKKDNWAFGYTTDYVVGAWVGNNDNRPMNQQLASGVTGASPIWNKIMAKIIQEHGSRAFVRPSGIAEAVVDGRKDLVMSGVVTKSVVGQGRKKIKDDKTQEEKDTITFTDPFSTYTPTDQKPTVGAGGR